MKKRDWAIGIDPESPKGVRRYIIQLGKEEPILSGDNVLPADEPLIVHGIVKYNVVDWENTMLQAPVPAPPSLGSDSRMEWSMNPDNNDFNKG